MSIKRDNTYFQEDYGKVYYYDADGIRRDVPSSAFADLEEQIKSIGNPLTYIGALSAEQINALTGVKHGSVYSLLDEGVISGSGYSFPVRDGDEVAWTSATNRWVQIGTNSWKEGENISLSGHTIAVKDKKPILVDRNTMWVSSSPEAMTIGMVDAPSPTGEGDTTTYVRKKGSWVENKTDYAELNRLVVSGVDILAAIRELSARIG